MKSLAPQRILYNGSISTVCPDSFDRMISDWKHGLLQRDRLLVWQAAHLKGVMHSLSVEKIVPLCKGSPALRSPRFKVIGQF